MASFEWRDKEGITSMAWLTLFSLEEDLAVQEALMGYAAQRALEEGVTFKPEEFTEDVWNEFVRSANSSYKNLRRVRKMIKNFNKMKEDRKHGR